MEPPRAPTAPSALPPASSIPSLSVVQIGTILAQLFHHSEQLNSRCISLLKYNAFADYQQVISAVLMQLESLLQSPDPADLDALDEILRSHPRMGEGPPQAGEASSAQSSGGVLQQQLLNMAKEYEACFNGLRFIGSVEGKSRQVLIDEMWERMKRGRLEQERQDAVKVRIGLHFCDS